MIVILIIPVQHLDLNQICLKIHSWILCLDILQSCRDALPKDSSTIWPGVVACTCNPATLEAEFRNGVGSIPVWGNSPSIDGIGGLRDYL